MNHTIWKYTIEDVWGPHTLKMPAGAQVLSVHEQNGEICLWAQVHGMQPKVDRVFQFFGTGRSIPATLVINDRLVFVGTFHLRPGAVGHLFEVIP